MAETKYGVHWTQTAPNDFCVEASDLDGKAGVACPKCGGTVAQRGTEFRDKDGDITHWVIVHNCSKTVGAKITIFND